MQIKAILTSLLILIGSNVYAQGSLPIVYPGDYLGWDLVDAMVGPFYPATAKIAQGFIYKYFADGATLGITISGVTCVDNPAPSLVLITCKALFPKFSNGDHRIVMTVRDVATESEKSDMLAFTYKNFLNSPKGLRKK